MIRAADFEQAAIKLANQLGVAARLVPHLESGAKTDDAARALSLPVTSIIKFLILREKKRNLSIGAILRGDERLDVKILQELSSTKQLSFAEDEFVIALTGFHAGGIPALSIIHCDFRFASDSLLKEEFIVGAGGHDRCGMAFRSAELNRIPELKFAHIAK